MKFKNFQLYLILFLISFIVISNQIALMQIFAYQEWYHFASIVISMALIGFGISGLIIPFIQRKFFTGLEEVIRWIIALTPSSFVLSLNLYLNVFGKFDSFLIFHDFNETIKLFFIILSFTINFTLMALIIGIIFSTQSEKINKLYFWNLFGSALGGVGIVFLFWIIFPQQVFVLNGLLICLFLLFDLFINRTKNFFILFVVVFSSLLSIYFFINPIEFKPSQFKTISKLKNLPDFKIEERIKSPYGLIEKASSDLIRFAPGLSLNYNDEIPPIDVILVNGEIAGFLLKQNLNLSKNFLTESTLSLPYRIRKFDNVLILNSLISYEIHRALANKTKKIYVAEQNPVLIRIMKEIPFDKGENQIFFENFEPRIFLERSNTNFDLIFYPAIEPVGITSGLYSAQEKYLFTTEAFQKIYDKLNDEGYFSISAFIDNPPRTFLKILTLLLSIKNGDGNNISREQIVAINNWNVITFLLKKGKFRSNEVNLINDFCEKYQFDFFINPETEDLKIKFNAVFDTAIISLVEKILDRNFSEVENYLFNIKPTTDNKPYFSNYINLKNFNSYLEQISLKSITYSELGYFLIWIAFGIILFFTILLFLLASLFTKVESELKWNVVIYFALIGLAYMIIEISLIQKFNLILSADVYSITFIICVLLISSGMGSLMSSKISNWIGNKFLIFVMIFFLGLVAMQILIHYSSLILAKNFYLKFLISSLLIFPLGFVMGFPFPLGIKYFAVRDKNAIPLAWVINGSFSVFGSFFAVITLINFGFVFSFASALILYLICGVFVYKKKF
ncbi:MAG: hypothetical protein N3F03_09045 [Ignavibacteria bacterium]|nr:hypothetical protein [Ignavibacteria bacterium]